MPVSRILGVCSDGTAKGTPGAAGFAEVRRGISIPSLSVLRYAHTAEAAAEAAYTSLPGSALLFGVSFSAASALPRDAAAGRGALTLDPRRVFLQSGCIRTQREPKSRKTVVKKAAACTGFCLCGSRLLRSES